MTTDNKMTLDARLHSGNAEDVAQWLYANGHRDAAATVRNQLDVRNIRIRQLQEAIEDLLLCTAAKPNNLQQALNVLENAATGGLRLHGDDVQRMHEIVDRIAPRASEPVAFRSKDACGRWMYGTPGMTLSRFDDAEALFTHPRTKAESACTCPSGDGSLHWPCPKHSSAATTCPHIVSSDEGTSHCALAEADARDAARLDYLADHVPMSAIEGFGGIDVSLDVGHQRQALREAIDAAMKKPPGDE